MTTHPTPRDILRRVIACAALSLISSGVVNSGQHGPRTIFNDDAQMSMETPRSAASSFVKAIYENIETVLAPGIRPTTAKVPPARPQVRVKPVGSGSTGKSRRCRSQLTYSLPRHRTSALSIRSTARFMEIDSVQIFHKAELREFGVCATRVPTY